MYSKYSKSGSIYYFRGIYMFVCVYIEEVRRVEK